MIKKNGGGMGIIFLKEKVKSLPATPGVYLMKDSTGTIIYVGKAKNLNRRVQSYFQHSKAHPQKIIKLVSNIRDFEFILTDTEFEAFMLECKLIREIKPLFNKMMKSPQSYSYIVINRDKVFRTIDITNTKLEQDGRLYFGPFPSKTRVEQAIIGIKETFKILCSSNKITNSPCLNHSLGLCIGMCRGNSVIQEYNKIVDNIIGLLSGKDMAILEEMKLRMALASESFDFEAAATYRDRIEAINFLIKKEKVIEFTEKQQNVAVLEFLGEETCKLFLIKRNKILFSKKFDIDQTSVEHLSMLILTKFNNDSPQPFKELDREEIDEAQIIYNFIKSSHCHYITIPKKWILQQNQANVEKALNKLISNKIKVKTT
ncbi:GIY-YIG nuclease family protein [Neobacillus sp. DY30]|uniref:GIY-YIG nuclease family protein n=1 Tax=Neobacillus sp. DY30 TaxID=3047871 RepID=UPI0024C0B233|nr:GIY-YIG nuclease family protein [Neobacillus sp. DY30]WHY01740.1 GIY-YIG nuclease family protein [Neobacillus sp. DY30]